jgi:hypothetical protein
MLIVTRPCAVIARSFLALIAAVGNRRIVLRKPQPMWSVQLLPFRGETVTIFAGQGLIAKNWGADVIVDLGVLDLRRDPSAPSVAAHPRKDSRVGD